MPLSGEVKELLAGVLGPFQYTYQPDPRGQERHVFLYGTLHGDREALDAIRHARRATGRKENDG